MGAAWHGARLLWGGKAWSARQGDDTEQRRTPRRRSLVRTRCKVEDGEDADRRVSQVSDRGGAGERSAATLGRLLLGRLGREKKREEGVGEAGPRGTSGPARKRAGAGRRD